MAKITRSNGHRLDSIAHIQLGVGTLERPNPEDLGFSLDAVSDAVVSLSAEIPADAMTAQTLGTERAGNGVIIDEHGLVLTIGYLISEATAITLKTAHGEEIPGETVAYDYETGFGLIRALAPLGVAPVEIGEAGTVMPGDPVVVAGHADGGGAIAAQVVAKREFAGYWEYLLDEAIFTSPPHPNWGGTALIDKDGRLVGIGSLFVQETRTPDEHEPGNMFVPIDLLHPVYHDLVTLGRANRESRPWLGMFTTESSGHLIVAGLYSNGPAERAGLEQLDVILRVDNHPVKGLADMYRKVWGAGDAGTRVGMTVLRDGKIVDVVIETADRYTLMRVSRPH
ncbi:MAG: signal protein PDZ [Alphaproteobacteria bacterium]|nr:signal protein PDZ [Alphaproteobacteria bacterium]|tara:strand:+ start:11897 stop:12913 length:1017 start_codon:yes stop_codon:yes gene_type:complete